MSLLISRASRPLVAMMRPSVMRSASSLSSSTSRAVLSSSSSSSSLSLLPSPLFVLSKTMASTGRFAVSQHYLQQTRAYSAGAGALTREEVERRVLDVLKNYDKVNPEKLKADSTFASLGLDSLDAVEVVIAMEDEFGIDIPEAESEKILSVPDTVKYILAQRGGHH